MESELFYVGSRYYDPVTCRMLNADTTDTLTKTLDDLTDKNLFAYCDNNPIMRDDYDGEFWQYAFVGAGADLSWGAIGTSILAGLGAITPVGWVVIGVAVVAVVGTIVYAKSKGKTQRPDQKRRGSEDGEKKNNRDRNKGKKSKYRTEKKPKSHKPSKPHQKC